MLQALTGEVLTEAQLLDTTQLETTYPALRLAIGKLGLVYQQAHRPAELIAGSQASFIAAPAILRHHRSASPGAADALPHAAARPWVHAAQMSTGLPALDAHAADAASSADGIGYATQLLHVGPRYQPAAPSHSPSDADTPAALWGVSPADVHAVHAAAHSCGMAYKVGMESFDATRVACNVNSKVLRLMSGMALNLHVDNFTGLVAKLVKPALRAHFTGFAAECLILKKEYEAASRLRERSRDAGCTSDTLTSRLAFLRATLGQLGEAERVALSSRDAPEVTPYRHAALGEACRRRGAFAQALTHFKAADDAGLQLRQVHLWRALAVKQKTTYVKG